MQDPSNKKLSIVLSSRRKFDNDDLQLDDEDKDDFMIRSSGCDVPVVPDCGEEVYVRHDHDEGTYVRDDDRVPTGPSQKKRKKN